MNTLIELFLKRPLLTNIFMLAIILVGGFSVLNMNRQLFPNAKLDLVFITTIYPGASPKEVEQNVTRHIEEELKSVSGMKKYKSYSMDGVSSIIIEIDAEADDPGEVVDDIRRAVSRVSELPDEVEGVPIVDELESSDIPILEIGVTGELPYQEIRKIAKVLEREIENVPGVKEAEKVGLRDKEIHVDINPRKLATSYLSLQEIITAINNRSVRVQGGSIETKDTIRYIMTLSQFDNAEDIRNVIVRANYSGKSIRVKDIATVTDGFAKEGVRNRINRRDGISLIVVKKSGFDQLTLTDKVKEIVEKNRKMLKKKYGNKVEIEEAYDTSYFVRNRLNTIISNAIIGFSLVLITLFIFLNFKIAFWTAMGIPVAVFIGFTIIQSLGLSINVITMGSFIMVLGMLVDDAIIVGENIYRHRMQGLSPLDAARKGLDEVFWPVVCTVVTTIVAFTPLLGIKGMMGKFVWAVPVVISIALIGSLLDCFFILPNHVTHSKFNIESGQRKEKLISFLRNIYGRVLTVALNRRYIVVSLFILALIGSSVFYMKFVHFKMFPEEAAELFWIKVEAKRGDSLNKTEGFIRKIEDAVWQEGGDDLNGLITHIGSANEWGSSDGISFPHQAILFVYLTSANNRKRTGRMIMERVQKRVGKPEGLESLRFVLDSGGPPTGRAMDVNIHCDKKEKRKEYTNFVFDYIKTIPGSSAVRRGDQDIYEQINMVIDYDKVARFGLSVSNIASSIRLAFDGIKTTEIVKDNEVIEVRLGFPKKYRQDAKELMELGIRNIHGKLIKMHRFAGLGKRKENATIFHYNGESTTQIRGELNQNITTSHDAMELIKKKFQQKFDDDPEVSLGFSGEAEVAGKTVKDLLRSLLISICLIYIILLLLFNSLTQPFMIMLAIPFGFIGIVFTLYFHGISMSFMSAIGAIGLSGVVVNDSLVMVNFINSLKRKTYTGDKMTQIIVDAAKVRLRPIILTTVTTVCGLIPTAYGIGGSDIFIRRMVLPMAWGLLFATLLTLILIPCLYHIDYDLKTWLKKRVASLTNKVAKEDSL